MSIRKLTVQEKKQNRLFRAEQRRFVKAKKQSEIILACFAYVMSNHGAVSGKQIKYINDFISSLKEISSVTTKVSNRHLWSITRHQLTKILSVGLIPSVLPIALQHKILAALFDIASLHGTITEDSEELINSIAHCLKFPLTKLSRIKSKNLSKEKARRLLDERNQKINHSTEHYVHGKPIGFYYKVLGCVPSDTLATIKKSYRKLATIHHPDKHISKNHVSSETLRFVREFQKLQEAYEILCNTLSSKD